MGEEIETTNFFSPSLAISSINFKIKMGRKKKNWEGKGHDLWSKTACNLRASTNNPKPCKGSYCFCPLSPYPSQASLQKTVHLPTEVVRWAQAGQLQTHGHSHNDWFKEWICDLNEANQGSWGYSNCCPVISTSWSFLIAKPRNMGLLAVGGSLPCHLDKLVSAKEVNAPTVTGKK